MKKRESNETRPSSNHSYWSWSWHYPTLILLESASNHTWFINHSWLITLWNHHPTSKKILDLYPSSFECRLTHSAPSTFFSPGRFLTYYFSPRSNPQCPVTPFSTITETHYNFVQPLQFPSPRFSVGKPFGSLTSIIQSPVLQFSNQQNPERASAANSWFDSLPSVTAPA